MKLNESQKMMLFLNQPIFFEGTHQSIIDKIANSGDKNVLAFENLKTIYPSTAQIERLSNLEEARERVVKDK